MKVNSITKKEKEEEKIKIKFPLIAKSKHNGSVVIFLSDTEGVVITGYQFLKEGERYDDLVSCRDKTEWKILTGKIIIELDLDA